MLTAERDSLREQVDRTYGKNVNRYAATNEDKVRLRQRPDTGSYRLRELKLGKQVLVVKEILNSRDELWAFVEVDGQSGYIMMQFLDYLDDSEE